MKGKENGVSMIVSGVIEKLKSCILSTKINEKQVRIILTFIRFINNTDFCTFVKTRYLESENVLVALSNSILLQRDSKI